MTLGCVKAFHTSNWFYLKTWPLRPRKIHYKVKLCEYPTKNVDSFRTWGIVFLQEVEGLAWIVTCEKAVGQREQYAPIN